VGTSHFRENRESPFFQLLVIRYRLKAKQKALLTSSPDIHPNNFLPFFLATTKKSTTKN